jgi:hypothetical protein
MFILMCRISVCILLMCTSCVLTLIKFLFLFTVTDNEIKPSTPLFNVPMRYEQQHNNIDAEQQEDEMDVDENNNIVPRKSERIAARPRMSTEELLKLLESSDDSDDEYADMIHASRRNVRQGELPLFNLFYSFCNFDFNFC